MGLDRTGSQLPRPPLPSPRTASTQQEPPHRCPQLGLPHRRPREHRPHQGTPSSHPLSNSTHHPQPDMRGIDHADPLQRHTHPTTRSHRSPPERPTAHTQASTHTHNRQAVNGPHTHAQPHRRDHHEHHHQPTRHTQASHNHQDHEAPTPEDTSSTTAARPAHNALTSGNTKHHDDEITSNQKTFPSNPRG